MKRYSINVMKNFSFTSLARRSIMNSTKKVSLISVPLNQGQPHLGPDMSPRLLKMNGLTNMLEGCGWSVNEIPDLQFSCTSSESQNEKHDVDMNKVKNCYNIGSSCEQIHRTVASAAKEDDMLLILGGDHSIAMGTVSAICRSRPKTGIVWVDAHADINTPAGTGNMHGMPLAFLMGLVDNVNKYPGFHWFQAPYLSPSDVVYIGLRDLDAFEKRIIKQLNIKAYTMFEIDKLGIGRVMEECLDYLNDHQQLHVSYDIDALDPFYAPHTGTAVRGGLTFREGNYICEILADTNKLRSMDLVEVNPSLHPDLDHTRTIEVALTIIGSAMGQKIL